MLEGCGGTEADATRAGAVRDSGVPLETISAALAL
jgi:hypothetical protein